MAKAVTNRVDARNRLPASCPQRTSGIPGSSASATPQPESASAILQDLLRKENWRTYLILIDCVQSFHWPASNVHSSTIQDIGDMLVRSFGKSNQACKIHQALHADPQLRCGNRPWWMTPRCCMTRRCCCFVFNVLCTGTSKINPPSSSMCTPRQADRVSQGIQVFDEHVS